MKGEEKLDTKNGHSVAATAQVKPKGFTGSHWGCSWFPLDMGGFLPIKGMKSIIFYLVWLIVMSTGQRLIHWITFVFFYFWHSIINVSNYVTLNQLWL